jgi:hypothetical protein
MARTTLRSMIDGPYPLAGIRGASPLAKHVSNHIQDPVGATKEGFEDLQQKSLEYEQAKDNMRRQLAPVESVIQHVKDTHDLDPDAELGYQDPNNPNQMQPGGMQLPGMPMKPGQMPQMQPGQNPNLPPNMQQKPGMMQQARPGANVSQPGTGPRVAQPGQPQQEKPVAKKAASNGNGKKSASPKGQPQRGIKVHVTAGATPGITFRSGHTTVMDAAKNASMRFGGPGSGRRPGGGRAPGYPDRHEAGGMSMKVAHKFGYRPNTGPNEDYDFAHKDGHMLNINPDGSWEHRDNDGGRKEGEDAGQLGAYLRAWHGK